MSIRFAVLGIAQVCCRAKDIRDEDSVTNAVISVLFLFLCAFAWDPLQVLVCNGRTTCVLLLNLALLIDLENIPCWVSCTWLACLGRDAQLYYGEMSG